MLVATFRPNNAWAGRCIDCVDGEFLLEEHGRVFAADVLTYDDQGHLRWATDDMRDWVQSQAAPPVPPLDGLREGDVPPEPPEPDPVVEEYRELFEQITMTSVAETVTELLTRPFAFHGDTGIRDYLHARLDAAGGARLRVDDPRPGYSTRLLQSEHYTQAQYIGSGQTPRGARFDLALTLPPEDSGPIEKRRAENLEALFGFELGKNKGADKVIDPDILQHAADATPGTSDVSKLYRELVHHDLVQGWAIEFYDSIRTGGATTIWKALRLCNELQVPKGKRLVVVFAGYSERRKHLVSSNDADVQAELIRRLAESGIEAAPEWEEPPPPPPGGGDKWTVALEVVFKERSEFAKRIIRASGLRQNGRRRYVNMDVPGPRTLAQVHAQRDGIGLVLCRRGDHLPEVLFTEIPVSSLTGYSGPNQRWLDGSGDPYEAKGPAVAFLVPDAVAGLGDDGPEWRDIVRLLKYARTL